MELDDSHQHGIPAVRALLHRNSSSRCLQQQPHVGLGLTNILTLPFTLTLSFAAQLFNFIFRVLRIPFPRLHFAGGLNFFRAQTGRPPSETPRDAADRFVRELEEETGALSISRAVASMGNEAGSSSSAKAREAGALANRRILPDFFLGSYEDALAAAKRDARILCVVLLSSEHDDVPEFKRCAVP